MNILLFLSLMMMYRAVLTFISLSFLYYSNAQEAVLRNGRSVVYSAGKRYLEPEESEYFQTVVLKTRNTFQKACPDGYVLQKNWMPVTEDAQRSNLLDQAKKPLPYEVVFKWMPENNPSGTPIWMKIIVNAEKFNISGSAPFQLKQDSLSYYYSSKMTWNDAKTGIQYSGNGAIIHLGQWKKPVVGLNAGKSSIASSALWPKPSFLQVNNIVVIIAAPEAIIQQMLDKIPAERLQSLLNYKEYWP